MKESLFYLGIIVCLIAAVGCSNAGQAVYPSGGGDDDWEGTWDDGMCIEGDCGFDEGDDGSTAVDSPVRDQCPGGDDPEEDGTCKHECHSHEEDCGEGAICFGEGDEGKKCYQVTIENDDEECLNIEVVKSELYEFTEGDLGLGEWDSVEENGFEEGYNFGCSNDALGGTTGGVVAVTGAPVAGEEPKKKSITCKIVGGALECLGVAIVDAPAYLLRKTILPTNDVMREIEENCKSRGGRFGKGYEVAKKLPHYAYACVKDSVVRKIYDNPVELWGALRGKYPSWGDNVLSGALATVDMATLACPLIDSLPIGTGFTIEKLTGAIRHGMSLSENREPVPEGRDSDGCPNGCDDNDPCTIDMCIDNSCYHDPDPGCSDEDTGDDDSDDDSDDDFAGDGAVDGASAGDENQPRLQKSAQKLLAGLQKLRLGEISPNELLVILNNYINSRRA